MEDHFKAHVLQVSNVGLVTHLTDPEDRPSGSPYLRPAAAMGRVDVADRANPLRGGASRAALLFQNGTQDIYALPADGLCYQEAGSEPKTVRWYRVGHILVMDGAGYRDQAECLSEMIGISIGRLAVPVDPLVLAAHAGRYQSSNGPVICVDGSRIFLQVPNEPRSVEFPGDYELVADCESNFHPGVSDSEIAFYRNDSGQVDRMEVVGVFETPVEVKKKAVMGGAL